MSESIVHKTHAFACGLERLAERTLQASVELSFPHALILMAIGTHPGISQKDIASYRNVTEAAVSRQIDSMRRIGLVKRLHNPKNRREHVLSLTPLGRRRLKAAVRALETTYADLFSGVDASARKGFLACLDGLLAKMCPKGNCLKA